MGLAEDAMARLGERHAAERLFVRDVTRRFDRVAAAAGRARMALEEAERSRAAVLAEWALASGWLAARVAEVAGLCRRAVSDAIRTSTAPGSHCDIRPDGASPPGGAMRPPPSGRQRPPNAAIEASLAL